MKRYQTAAALLALMLGATAARAETVTLTTLDWCPYTCAALPENGLSTVIVTRAFKAMGYEVKVEFLPWQRAVQTAETDAKVAGYFPEYAGSFDKFTLSASLGDSPLGLVVPAGKSIADVGVPALSKLKLGVVSGYVNTEAVDKAIADKTLPVEAVKDDVTNLRKVAAGRIDAAIIDEYVMRYELSANKELAGDRGKLAFNPTVLENKSLHIAFARTPLGEKMKAAFDDGLRKIDVKAIQAEYFSRLGSM